ncbi:MAG: methyl-accepting chemotaxis protein [Oceanospirillaceae bacterium]|jgi:methyl-accepting chemotaxis protein
MSSLIDNLNSTQQTIRLVEARGNDINAIIDGIKGTAEQTNLLALNAVIEAAGAGYQGQDLRLLLTKLEHLRKKINNQHYKLKRCFIFAKR